MIGKLPANYLVRSRLQAIACEHKVDACKIFFTHVVNRMAHIFWHDHMPLFKLLSLHSSSRLRACRLVGAPCSVSASRLSSWNVLQELGLGLLGPPVGGRPNTRGGTGAVIRWGEGWFEEVRDGVGWNINRKDEPATKVRVDILIMLVVQTRSRLDSLLDEQLCIVDGSA